MTEDQKMEEGKRMFSIFAARMFEQRVLQAYREKVAQERQLQLLRELEDEDKRRSVTPGPVPGPKEPTPAPEPGPSVRRYNFSARGVNVKRITRQLAPRSQPMLSQTNKLFAKRDKDLAAARKEARAAARSQG